MRRLAEESVKRLDMVLNLHGLGLPSFFWGVRSAFDLLGCGQYLPLPLQRDPWLQDTLSMQADWMMVGRDLRKALDTHKK